MVAERVETTAEIAQQCEAILAASKQGAKGQQCPSPAKWLVEGTLSLCGQHAWNREREPLPGVAPVKRAPKPQPAEPEALAEPAAVIGSIGEQPSPSEAVLNVKVLRDMVYAAKKGVSGRCPQPVQNNVLLETVGDELCVTGSDLEFCQVQLWTPGFKAALPKGVKRVTVPPSQLMDILKGFPAKADVALEVRESALVVRCGRFKQTVRGLPAADFGCFPSRKWESEGNVELELAPEWMDRVARVAAASGSDLFGTAAYVAFRPLAGETQVIATDTWRAAIDTLPTSATGKVEHERGCFLVPISLMKTLLSEKPRLGASPVTLTFTHPHPEATGDENGFVRFPGPNWCMIGRAGDAMRFPNVDKVVPTSPLPNTLRCDAADLRPALLRANVVAKRTKERTVSLWDLGGDCCLVSAECEEAVFTEELEAETGPWDSQPEGFATYLSWLRDSLPKQGRAVIAWDKLELNAKGAYKSGLVTVRTDQDPMFWLFTQHKMRNPLEACG